MENKVSVLDIVKTVYDPESTTAQVTAKQRELSKFLLEQEGYTCISGSIHIGEERQTTIGKLASNALIDTIQRPHLQLPGDQTESNPQKNTVIIGPNPFVEQDGIGLWIKSSASTEGPLPKEPPTIEYL